MTEQSYMLDVLRPSDAVDSNVVSVSTKPNPHGEGDPLLALRIMILDDEPYNCMVVRKHLRDGGFSNIVTLSDSTEAFSMIAREQPDLLLSDIAMPNLTGLELLRMIRSHDHSRRLPVLIFTASSDSQTKRTALDLGAADFLAKPIDPHELIPRVRNLLANKAYQDRLANIAAELEQLVRMRTAELEASRKEVIHCLARAAEYRDDNTGHHVIRVGRYVGVIARGLGFDDQRVEDLELAAQLHDVGKIGVPDALLAFDGKLDPEMLAVMRRHCAQGKQILAPIEGQDLVKLRAHSELGGSLLRVGSSPLLMLASTIAQTHHEWWNGQGYPLGLAGEDIPIEGRITAVADVFDALSTPRPYKAAIPREKCFAIMAEQRGTQFDPAILDAFFQQSAAIIRTQLDYMDCE